MEECTEAAPRHDIPHTSHLLLVDDDPALLDALWGTLDTRFGHYTLDVCDSGARGLELAKQQHYDTIIVDVNMLVDDDLLALASLTHPSTSSPTCHC